MSLEQILADILCDLRQLIRMHFSTGRGYQITRETEPANSLTPNSTQQYPMAI